jgi:hypothetical protein
MTPRKAIRHSFLSDATGHPFGWQGSGNFGPAGAHYPVVRAASAITLSLAFHVAVAAVFVLRPAPHDDAPPEEPAPAMAGETFELPAPDTQLAPLANASPSPDDVGNAAPSEAADAPARPTPPRVGAHAARPSNAGRPSAGRTASGDAETEGSASSGLTFGATGDRSATDLLTAITHGFAQGASGDPAWRNAPLGAAGDATLTIVLGDDGHIESTAISGNPSPALTSGINRTMALIKGRPFVAKGKVTKLHLNATVSNDAVHDSSGADVFAIGRSVAGGEGHGWFALSIGRRIDLRVR